MSEYRSVADIPRRTKVRVKTISGLERTAYVREYAKLRVRDGQPIIAGCGHTPSGSWGDLTIVGWLPL